MTNKTICVLGGTGFVGGHLVTRLINAGYTVRLVTRQRERCRQFLVMPKVELNECASLDSPTLETQLSGCDAVINLIGILHGDDDRFRQTHVELVTRILAACAAVGVPRYLHMSGLNADAEQGGSMYLRSKGEGEDAAHRGSEQGVAVSSFRPSVIFGPGDGFFHRFAALLRIAPVLPLACPNARLAPVYVGDVVDAMVLALADENTLGQRYELCGPKIYTLRELVEYSARLAGLSRFVWGLSDKLSQTQAKVFERLFRWLPGDPPFSLDNYRSLQTDSVCSSDGLAALGITPRSVESVMPRVFGADAARARYSRFRSFGRR